MDVAVLAMGNMGRAIAMRLLDGGHRVVVWNRTPDRAAEVVAAGAAQAPSVADALHGADVVVTMLANDDAVRAVAFGELRSYQTGGLLRDEDERAQRSGQSGDGGSAPAPTS